MIKLAVTSVLATMFALSLAACGGGSDSTDGEAEEARTPSPTLVELCLEHGGTQGRLHSNVVPAAEIGGLPKHITMEIAGYPEGDLEFGSMYVLLFRDAIEGADAVPVLEEENPDADIGTYAGGTTIGIVVGGKDPGRNQRLIQGCVEPVEKPTGEAVAECLEGEGFEVEQNRRAGYEEVVGLAEDEGVIGVFILGDPSQAGAAEEEVTQFFEQSRPQAMSIVRFLKGEEVLTAITGPGQMPSEANEELALRCAK